MPAAATDENVEKKIFAFRSMASAFRETRSRLLGNDVIQEVTDNGKVNGPPLPHITLHQVKQSFKDMQDRNCFLVANCQKDSIA